MTRRTTHAELQTLLERLAEATGKTVATKDNGWVGLSLEHNSVYGGWRIVETVEDVSGEYEPFGTQRRPAREMADVMRFALYAIPSRDEVTR